MQEMIRWPSSVQCSHSTGALTTSRIAYHSALPMQPSPPPEIANCIVAPAQRRRVVLIRMMIVARSGATSNLAQLQLVVARYTGQVMTVLPTTPPAIDPKNASVWPLLTWLTVFTGPPGQRAAWPVIDDRNYLGVRYKTVGGLYAVGSNDFIFFPEFEVTLE